MAKRVSPICSICVALAVSALSAAGAAAFDTVPGLLPVQATVRKVVAMSLGQTDFLDGRQGIRLRLPGVGVMLMLGYPPFPERGTSVVAQGPWLLSTRWRGGIMWGGLWKSFEWPPLESLFPNEKFLKGTGGWRQVLVNDSSFISRRSGRLTAEDPPVDLVIEAYYYEDRASQALSGRAVSKLRAALRKIRVLRTNTTFGKGPRPVYAVRYTTNRIGNWRTSLVYAASPGRRADEIIKGKQDFQRAFVFATGGPWIVVFSAHSPVLVEDVAKAYLLQVAP